MKTAPTYAPAVGNTACSRARPGKQWGGLQSSPEGTPGFGPAGERSSPDKPKHNATRFLVGRTPRSAAGPLAGSSAVASA